MLHFAHFSEPPLELRDLVTLMPTPISASQHLEQVFLFIFIELRPWRKRIFSDGLTLEYRQLFFYIAFQADLLPPDSQIYNSGTTGLPPMITNLLVNWLPP